MNEIHAAGYLHHFEWGGDAGIVKVYGERRNFTVLLVSSMADEQEKQIYSKVCANLAKVILRALPSGQAFARYEES